MAGTISDSMSGKLKGQPRWIRKILNEFGELQEFQPKPFNEDPEWPEWVTNLWLIVLGISYPGVKLKRMKQWKAKDLGKFLGRQYAVEHVVWGEVPLSGQVIQEGQRFAAGAKERAEQLQPNINWRQIQKEFEAGQKVWRPRFRKFIQAAVACACERPYREASAFFEGFGKAIVIKPDDLLTERRLGVGDKIGWTMIMMWREIEGLESVGQLHRLFEQALKPHGIEVGHKRIEKLCQRIQLKFRGPGRPPGSKIQTNRASV